MRYSSAIALSDNYFSQHRASLSHCCFIHVEAALYDYHKDLEFPYGSVARELAWLPKYIVGLAHKQASNVCHKLEDDFLINIILVFRQAGTSALINTYPFRPPAYKIKAFVWWLNSILQQLLDNGGKTSSSRDILLR